MSRKRKTSESFAQYRTNLKAEAAALKDRLAGRFVHISTLGHRFHKKGLGSTYVRGTGISGHINRQF